MTFDIWWLWLLLLWTNPFILFEVVSILGTVLPPGYSLWLFSYKHFLWCRWDARLWHACYLFHNLSLLCYCISINKLLACIRDFTIFVTGLMIIKHFSTELSLLYYTRVHNVCEYIQKYSLACPWLFSWLDFAHGEERCDDSPGTYAMMIAASRR